MIRNGVPEEVCFLAECRSLKHDKAQALTNEIEKITLNESESYGAKAEIKIDNLCKAVEIPKDSWAVKATKKALKKAGVDARLEHLLKEHIYIDDMEKALIMIVELLGLSAE